MGAIGFTARPLTGAGNNLSGAHAQMINISQTYIPDYDDEVISLHMQVAFSTGITVNAAVYDITLGVESSFRVGSHYTMSNGKIPHDSITLDAADRIALPAGREYAIAYGADANTWLFLPSSHLIAWQVGSSYKSLTQTGTEAFADYWGGLSAASRKGP